MTNRSHQIVLLACGCFNPPTIMHFRMFELARDYFHLTRKWQVIEGIFSPVSDHYAKKKELATSKHRAKMLQLVCHESPWLRVDSWESSLTKWMPTVEVLRYHRKLLAQRFQGKESGEINDVVSATSSSESSSDELSPKVIRLSSDDGQRHQLPQLLLLCGADFLHSFSVPRLWDPSDLEEIVRDFGLVVISRANSCTESFVANHQLLSKYRDNVHVVDEWMQNEISSTKVRAAIASNRTIRYVVPQVVCDYIVEQKLYQSQDTIEAEV